MRHELLKIEDALVLDNKSKGKREGERGAIEQERVRPQLRPYAALLVEELRRVCGTMTSAAASKFLRSKDGYKELIEGSFPSKGQFGRFINMFGQFQLTTPVGGGFGNVSLKDEPVRRRLREKTPYQLLSTLS